MSQVKTYKGQIEVKDYGDSDDVVFLSGVDKPLAMVLEEDIVHKEVSIRYWITDREASLDKADEAFLQRLFGKIDVEFCARYSEITGYLWTDEELKIGGHDLLDELYHNKGHWLILEITIHA